MLFNSVVLLAALAGSSLASPLAARGVWTMQSFSRQCDSTANTCGYSFHINTNDGSGPTLCEYKVVGASGSSAATQSYNNVYCGPTLGFVIGSTWSGQFGPGNGFQTLSVVTAHQIIYPAYTDNELANGNVVSPDKSFTAQALPGAKFVAPNVQYIAPN